LARFIEQNVGLPVDRVVIPGDGKSFEVQAYVTGTGAFWAWNGGIQSTKPDSISVAI
jgi:hypothetical protein